MSHTPPSDDRLFRLCLQTVEYFGVSLIVLYWALPFTGSTWGAKHHYSYLLDASVPLMIIVFVSGLLAWDRYPMHSIIHLCVLLAWALWAGMPRP
jgi:hypothetical protein